MLHDLGLAEKFIRDDRFEIDGADAAAEFLARQGYSDKKIAVIWDAIALHATLHVPQRKQPEIAQEMARSVYDLARLAQRELEPADLENVVARQTKILENLSSLLI